MSLRYFLFLNNYLLERSRLFIACFFWLWPLASEQDPRGSVSKFRLRAAGPSTRGAWTGLELLTKGSEHKRTHRGENVFFKALQSVFTMHRFGGTSFQPGSQLPHRQQPHTLGFVPFCLKLEFAQGPESRSFKGAQPGSGPHPVRMPPAALRMYLQKSQEGRRG